jgi:hypothetical protein
VSDSLLARARAIDPLRAIAALSIGGLALLLVELRLEHAAALRESRLAWTPLLYCAAMVCVGVPSLLLWRRGGARVLLAGFALAPLIGLAGFFAHSDGDLRAAAAVVLSSPKKPPRPPPLAPLAFVGLGVTGVLACKRPRSRDAQAAA